MVITLDFESSNLGSNPGRTFCATGFLLPLASFLLSFAFVFASISLLLLWLPHGEDLLLLHLCLLEFLVHTVIMCSGTSDLLFYEPKE